MSKPSIWRFRAWYKAHHEDKASDAIMWFWVIIVALFMLSLWGANFLFLYNLEPEQRGTFGDMFGTVNALFSGFAFAGIIFTILLQKKELSSQREALLLQHEELKATRKEFQAQNTTLRQQRFENTFFKLIDLHHQIVDRMAVRENPALGFATPTSHGVIRGKDAFLQKYSEIKHRIRTNTKATLDDFWEQAFTNMWQEDGHHFSVYFRNLEAILKLLHNLSVDDDSRKEVSTAESQYLEIMKAQFTRYELLLLYYYGYSGRASFAMQFLVAKYKLYTMVLPEDLLTKSHWKLGWQHYENMLAVNEQ